MNRVDALGGVEVRRMRAGDVNAVVAIETGAFTSPWSAETFTNLLDRAGLELLVLEDEREAVLGYAVLWCVLDQGELANVAVAPGLRGRGLGSHLLASVLEVARRRGIETVFLEVRPSNAPAMALYRRFGFSEVGLRRAYYTQPKEDALIMSARL